LYGRQNIIKWWMASGREMDLGKPGDEKTDVIWKAKKERKTEVVSLLERFRSDATKTRSEMRMELGIPGQSVHLLLAPGSIKISFFQNLTF